MPMGVVTPRPVVGHVQSVDVRSRSARTSRLFGMKGYIVDKGRLIHRVSVAAAALVLAGASQATITVYTTLATFQAVAGTTGTDTFAGLDTTQSTAGPLSRSAGSFSYTADTGTIDGLYGGGTVAEPFLSTNAAADTITLSGFGGNVYALAGNFFDSSMSGAYTSGSITIVATDSGGNQSRTITPTSMSNGSFLAFVSDVPLLQVTVAAVQQGSTFRWPGVDNLMLAAASPVPEPGAYVFLACGVGLVAFLARRRREV